MRTVSAAWLTNQTQDAACPTRLDAWVDTEDDGVGGDRHWTLSNDDGIDNVIDASLVSTFDVTRNSLPVESMGVTFANGTGTDDDFTVTANLVALNNPGQMGLLLGNKYDTGTYDALLMSVQQLDGATVSDDQLSLTVNGVSFALKLDDETYHDGKHHPNGIAAYLLFQQLLDAMFTVPLPGWNYHVGSSVVSATLPLWQRNGASAGTNNYIVGAGACVTNHWMPLYSVSQRGHYTIDAALKTVLIYQPIPPMTYREALVRLAAYAGAWIRHDSNGQLVITTSLGARSAYHLDVDRIYDTPKMKLGASIRQITGKTYSCGTSVGGTQSAKTVATFTPASLDPQVFRVTHEAYASQTLTLSGATLVEGPTYNTYSTVFTAAPTGGVITATVIGFPVSIGDSVISKTYPLAAGVTAELDNPIASDPTQTLLMFDHYQSYANAIGYTFTMRDDAAVEVGDRCYLDTIPEPLGVGVIVTDIKREFNGGTDGTYTVIVDPVA